MQTSKQKSGLFILFLTVGFLLGILYQNLIATPQLVPNELFTQSNIRTYLNTDIISEKFIWYVVKERLLLLIAICILSCMKWRKLLLGIFLGILGFLGGVFTVFAIMQFGIKGILLAFASVIPHGLPYAMGYFMLFTYWFQYPAMKWNRTKLIFVITMFLMGIILETYVNPVVIKWMFKWI